MNRSHFDPLHLHRTTDSAESRRTGRLAGRQSTSLDRWLLDRLASRFDNTRIRMALWDEPALKATDELPVTVRFADRNALLQLIANPAANFGDLYSAGRITVSGDLLLLLDEAYRVANRRPHYSRLVARLRANAPSLADARRNIHHHYDIGNEFYRLWLDRDAMQYTCAYYADRAMTVEQAQRAKMHHICRKLQLKPGEHVVEAGSGWGGFAIFMAKHYGARVRSFNISSRQVEYAREWAKAERQSGVVEFIEDDFRNIAGRYDAFVSVGMLEHVGVRNYRELGQLIDRVLTPQGRGLIHSIGRDRAIPLNPWIERRIFPGAYPPTLREMMEIFEPNGLSVLDIENIRLHYARTLEHWLERFEENLEAVRSMFDNNFVRAWRLYLAGSIMAFVHGNLQLFQVLFARSGLNSIPWTRAHVYSPGD